MIYFRQQNPGACVRRRLHLQPRGECAVGQCIQKLNVLNNRVAGVLASGKLLLPRGINTPALATEIRVARGKFHAARAHFHNTARTHNAATGPVHMDHQFEVGFQFQLDQLQGITAVVGFGAPVVGFAPARQHIPWQRYARGL
ncbi:MAG: hypothetical protein COW02_05815 [Comamonadaceae bacterium CG12_big_fil_rev_8_21_14_0_65_59_15]|nr:MAG: hypothetical protein COW02_05815 [Comamonadaceae bacterium CG12_big_fil_rev_8_21_14_0_65_59_15]